MIGNDVVDLIRSSSSWNRKRFQEKVYSEKEQELISTSNNPHQTAWLLWSMKEAAYKIWVQQSGKRSFHPTQLICDLNSDFTGEVSFGNLTLFTTSTLSEAFIHTIAISEHTRQFQSEVFEIEDHSYSSQSASLIHQLIESAALLTGLRANQLSVQKNKVGVPFIVSDAGELPLAVSLSHCGSYCGLVLAEKS